MTNPWWHFAQYSLSFKKLTQHSQRQWLMDCLKTNQQSAYGQRYQFAAINSIQAYQTTVPIVDYQTIEPWVNELVAGASDQLFKGEVIAFERTGGSHSGGKIIPYSAAGLADFRTVLLNWLAQIIHQYHLNSGTVYWALSPATRKPEVTSNGIPIGGGDALYLGAENLAAFSQLSAVPLSIACVSDVAEWQLLTLYYLLCHDDLRLISIWSPSFLIELLNALDTSSSTLLELLAKGGEIANHTLAPNELAAERLNHYLIHRNTAKLWPQLTLISCWADASSQSLANLLSDYFPNVVLQPKGLLSTEGVISIPEQDNQPLLCTQINFYEFLSQQGKLYLAHELKIGESYQVIITTHSGLYRYNTGDIVCCTGYQADRAILQFMGRAGLTSDLVGEKLTEPFVNRCLSSLKGFAALCPNLRMNGYILLLDNAYWHSNNTLITSIEQALANNPQYAYALKLKQLTPLTYQLLENPSQCYLTYQLAKGKRLGDIKIPSLLVESWQAIFSI